MYSSKGLWLLFMQWMLVASKVDKYVRIELDASWKQTPIHMEASEFLAEKKNESFWTLIDGMHGKSVSTDKELYELILDTSSKILASTELDVLKFSLSIRSYSARVQLFQQIAFEIVPADCPIFYQDSTGKITCNIDEVSTVDSTETSTLIQSFDHVYPGSEDNKHVVIVYADFMDSSFSGIHEKMLIKVKDENVKYVLRHFHQVTNNTAKVALSGYGVELAVKNSEYKAVDDQKVKGTKKKESAKEEEGDDEVEGFLFNRLRELHPHFKDNLDQFKSHLKESNKELAELRVWQLQDLSFQACQRIINAAQPEKLKVLKELSLNVPMVARTLVKTKVTDNMRDEIKRNQGEFERKQITAAQTIFHVNGLDVSVDEFDIFKLLSLINGETSSMAALSELDIEMGKAGKLMSLDIKPEQEDFVIDTRSESVQWINDLEKDPQYNYWPSHLQEILRPTFPGMLRYIAKNIFNVVAYLNPTSKEGMKLFKSLNELVEQSIPARFGVVFVAKDDVGASICRAFSFIKSDKSLSESFKFLSELYKKDWESSPTLENVNDLFVSWYDKSEAKEVLSNESEYDDLRRVSKIVFDGTGLKSLPQILVNGEQLPKSDTDMLESAVTNKILSQTNQIQQAIYMGSHHSYPAIYDYVMSQPNVVRRLNSIIQTAKGNYIHFGDYTGDLTSNPEKIPTLKKEEAAGALMNSVKYFVQEKGALTVWVVADAHSKDGQNLIKNALTYLKKHKNTRLSIVLHGEESEEMNMNDVLQMAMFLRQKLISSVGKLMIKLLEVEDGLYDIIKDEAKLKELTSGITGINKKKLFELFTSDDALKMVKNIVKINSLLVKQAFDVNPEDNIVVANGRVLGPLRDEDVFVPDDFELLQSFENNRCGFKVAEIVESMKLQRMPTEGHDRYKSDIGMKIVPILSEREDKTRSTLSYKSDEHSVVKIPPRRDGLAYDIVAVLDPLTKGAQKLVPILQVLHNTFNVNLKIFLNPKGKHSELPVKRFYQYVLQPALTFDDKGSLVNDQAAKFTNLPHSALLTLIMDTPQSWLIEASGSNHDLDNINLAQADEYVYGDYELEYIIIEGHCSDALSAQPPRGLQFVLGTEKQPDKFDTIVMANLGYFQLKAYPGSFILQLRDGRSSQVYEIDTLDGGTSLSGNQNYTVVVDNFKGQFLKVNVKRKPGQEKADLLSDGEEEDEDDSIWGSLASYVKMDESTKSTDGKIHIFSVCTGLLYERFLKVMMLSVLKHTKTPVKFWFLKNYLSAEITRFLPYYAKQYGFEYELVQYQWPEWLNGQTEKQRIIWGYKILFLDVLFPLNLERIIFVDADQIVRADLKELMEMDLDGAPYAYTPFCNDRPEVEGFRFWNHGYWRNHLGGRPYHISALYVVDLKRFRRVAAGDRLRGQYQGLSQDPNSLSNLDQDLPNNMIHQVQIKSLPQEWLWCETWCSDASKKNAKTIDMCNNPQTKEPKLQRAMRIAPEWVEYDNIVKTLHEEFAVMNKTTVDEVEAVNNEKVEL